MSDIVAVVNPAAGGGRASQVWQRLSAEGPASQIGVIRTAGVSSTASELRACVESGVKRILVVGGDGSMHQIANMLLELDYARNVSIGLVPVGTGSDLARSLGVSQDPAAALEQALAGQSKQIDVLELATDDGRRRFIINVASAGISGLVDQMVNSQPRRTRLAYLRATLAAILSYRPVSCRISIDDQLWYDGSVFLVAVANGKCFGRGMRIAPGAKLDDGQADVVLIQSLAPWQLLLRLHKIYRGAHVQSEHVRHARCKSFRLEPRGPIPPFDLDGEVFPSAAARITVRPGALGVLC